MLNLFISLAIKLFFLLTPFFVLSVFLSMTEHMDKADQRRVAIRTTASVGIISLILYFAGNPIFSTLGITLDGFRIGAGSLLFLSGVSLVSGKRSSQEVAPDMDFAVVPLAIPITVGPATIGTLLILGAELGGPKERLIGAAALLCACLCVGVILRSARVLKKLLGSVGLSIMTKITGLVLSALAAQIVFTGIKNFLG
ncbi:MAG: MarC family protein [Deltaproteobacteria bacterium]|nr:MarC family protein [Deltaproteobacteria bacterium]